MYECMYAYACMHGCMYICAGMSNVGMYALHCVRARLCALSGHVWTWNERGERERGREGESERERYYKNITNFVSWRSQEDASGEMTARNEFGAKYSGRSQQV
jgi:hypothetical protein